ncbi:MULTISPECIES: LysR family transcriptional regulator [Phyllobacteriaceae]|jgi:DNA-binding transcriptional LysR family regulator|uniref:LysR family transcriptional regulator n=1 Tax=Mesorhizobium hungaricum TaxID=1566387 RepID=A0A1C2DSG5_9HYPH|nr:MULTISPECIES: LysR family transcriptional regulator [Mesorhizobium]MBN9236175.1 LysR family transcriptional regulator [Mesorhizobium sp.]MDQ0327927.1 DNA-binding transcriptional LysR family regulator [Mesorhizobium sp. YL-MeA3-2017]OCX17707.1 LysR family transcriptional regulator [Mesorhizobium hungaricum]
MLNLNDLQFFTQAVDSGGFASAARRLGFPKSTISKRVAALEATLGVQLIHRTSRNFTLTDVGRDVYDHARAAMIEAEAAEAVVHRRLAEPSGIVRITTSVPTAQFRLAPRLPLLARQYPKLRVQLHVTDRFVDLVQDGFDIAVRSHFGPLPDSDLVHRRMGKEKITLVAAPSYIAERGEPATPEALSDHEGLFNNMTIKAWRLSDAEGRTVEVTPQPRLYADESVPLLMAAEAGLGVVCLPEMISAQARRQGRLVRVLPGWTAGSVITSILTPQKRGQLPAVRAVIDFLLQKETVDTYAAGWMHG